MTHPQSKIPYLPDRVIGLADLSHNLSWSWSHNARAQCAEDAEFLRHFDEVMQRVEREQSRDGTWFMTHHAALQQCPVVYFCAEFGFHNSVPIYSGGLGVLAGDHCKTASDLGIPLIGVGLFYMKGYFDQR